MTRKARTWTGVTILLVIALNYAVATYPLYNRMRLLESRVKVMMIRQVKSGDILNNTEDNYIIDVLKREMAVIDKRLITINCIAATIAVVVISWLLYGLIFNKERGIKE